jgi:hypothetical protein
MNSDPILRYKDYRELNRRLDREVQSLCEEKGLRYASARLVALENLSRNDVEAFFAVIRNARAEPQES